MILFYDTETTGLIEPHKMPDHPAQPKLVQLGALLCDEDGTERASVSLIVKPEGWEIPEGAAKAHGITTEMALRYGLPHLMVVATFTNLRALSDEIVAYNLPFDDMVMRAAIHRTGRTPSSPGPTRQICAMTMATPIVNLPPTARMLSAGFNKPKPPTLTECVKHFFDEPLMGAHDALVDARACARAYFHMRGLTSPAMAAHP